MYKWPQGRVIRIVSLLVLAVIAADIAWNGAYKGIGAYLASSERPMRQLISGIIFASLSGAVILAGLVLVGFYRRSVDFLIEVEGEMTRVEWPQPNQLMKSTFVVALVLAVVALLVLGVDGVFISIFRDLIPKLGA